MSLRCAAMIVFSAHAEVVPRLLANNLAASGILRVRGGSSLLGRLGARQRWYSPRTRR